MKKTLLYLPLLAVCSIMASCSKPDLYQDTKSAPYEVPGFSHSTLSFRDEAEMNATAAQLMTMSPAERNVWYIQQNPDFTSQEDAMWSVVAELNTLNGRDEIISCQSKYSPIFLFNYNLDDSDMSPYIPHEKIGVSLVCNAYGDVMIGGELVNVNNLTSYEQTDYAKCKEKEKTITRADERINYLFASTKDRKFWAEAKWAGPGSDVFIHYVAHENILGMWNKYNTDYHVSKDYIVAFSGVTKFQPFYERAWDTVGGFWRGEVVSYTDDRCFTPIPDKTISVGFRIYSRGVAEEGQFMIYYEV